MSPGTKELSLGVVVLAGGYGRRLGGVDKAAIELNGRTLLEHVISGFPPDCDMVVVGPERPVSRLVTWCRESPIGGGPLSAVATALGFLSTDLVAIVACDAPLLGPVIPLLIEAATKSVSAGGTGAGVRTSAGTEPPIPSFVSRLALVAALPESADNAALWPVVNALSLDRLTVDDDCLQDIDTADDLRYVTKLMDER